MAWSEGNAAAVSRHNAWKWERPRHDDRVSLAWMEILLTTCEDGGA
jgi:hypothetical protein